MNSSFESRKYNFGELLGNYERRRVVLPRFQRGYSWEKSQVATFWSDFLSFYEDFSRRSISASYFLGPMVIQESPVEIIVLDGQQRLATASILLAVLRDAARSLDRGEEHAGADLARDIQRELIEKDSDSGAYALTLGELDNVFFQEVVQSDPPVRSKPKLRSHQLILGAYEYLQNGVNDIILQSDAATALALIKDYKSCLTKGMIMVAITVQDEDDAFNIFETLNDRGLRLSVPDLVLNLLMRRCEQQYERDAVRQNWNQMLQQMGRRDISKFLRHMWLSMYGDLKARGLFSEIKDYVSRQSVHSVKFSSSCADECTDYISILEVDERLPKDARNNASAMVKYIRLYSSLPLLLSGIRCLNESDFTKLCGFVADLAVRYVLIANLNPADLESAFYEAAREIRGKHVTNESSSKCLLAARRILHRLNPDDSIVLSNAADLVLTRSEGLWLMTNLANAMQSATKEVSVDKISLEHIFPQNPGTSWPNRKSLDPYVWHIGNLTLLGQKLNNRAANSDFKTKRDSYYSQSEIAMTKGLLRYNAWTELEIRQRASDLAKQIASRWPGP